MCLAQGDNAVTLVRLEHAALWSRVKHSTTEPLPSLKNIWTNSRDFGTLHQQAAKAHMGRLASHTQSRDIAEGPG